MAKKAVKKTAAKRAKGAAKKRGNIKNLPAKSVGTDKAKDVKGGALGSFPKIGTTLTTSSTLGTLYKSKG